MPAASLPRSPFLVLRYATGIEIDPFNLPARACPILGERLAAIQERELARWSGGAMLLQDVGSAQEAFALARERGPALIVADNLFFTAEFLESFVLTAREQARSSRAALPAASRLAVDFVAPLNDLPRLFGSSGEGLGLPLYWIEQGDVGEPLPIVITMGEHDRWWMDLPPFPAPGATERVAFVHQPIAPSADFPPLRLTIAAAVALPIGHWVHLLTANIVLGIYGEALRFEQGLPQIFLSHGAELPRNLRDLVIIGARCRIDPTAILVGPTLIGDDTIVEAGACVSASIVGRGAHIGQGCQLRLTVVGDRAVFPPPVSAANFSVVLEDALVNSPLRFSVAGRGCFIGAGVWSTDRVLRDGERASEVSYGGDTVRVRRGDRTEESGLWILGCAVGDRARIGSGTIIYPGRSIAADSTITSSDARGATAGVTIVR
jgi:acetyltransferase-like isoleucine patch superfamily enzyme